MLYFSGYTITNCVWKLIENAVAWNESVITNSALSINAKKSSTLGLQTICPCL